MEPNVILEIERMPGRKKTKERIPVLVCWNRDGSDKYELMIIGTPLKPPTQEKTNAELGTEYHVKKKSWMTEILF